MKAWEAVPYPSSPNHPQSHGLIERYNRTLSNKIAKLLEEHEEALWTDVISVATEIVNNLVQEAVSDRDAWLAPSEIWFARNPILQSLPRVSVEPPTNVSRYVQRLKRHWEIVKEHVQTSTRMYQQRMRERRDKNKGNPLRKFGVGDEVTYYKPSKSKKLAKIQAKRRGPYKIIAVLPSGVDYTIRRVGSSNKRDLLKVHVDHLRKLKRFMGEGGEVRHQSKPVAPKRDETYEVECICGEREAEEDQKQYLVKWLGHEECTWEPEENLSCPDKVNEWTKLSAVQQKSKYNTAIRRGIVSAVEHSMSTEDYHQCCAVQEQAIRLIMDLSDLDVADYVQVICSVLGIKKSDVAAVLSSPPCETYSHADASNITRGNHYREHGDPLKPPRSRASVQDSSAQKKRELAQKHDLMVLRLTQQLVKTHEEFGVEILLENPVGSLSKRPFMRTTKWLQCVKRYMVTYCAYGFRYMKPTHIWTTLRHWQPRGTTGNGQCGSKCGNGEQHEREHRTTFVHKEHIAGSAARLPRGGKSKLWQLPPQLTREIMEALAEVQPDRKYVFDFFAGEESWRQAVEEQGYKYIPVDLTKLKNSGQSELVQLQCSNQAA